MAGVADNLPSLLEVVVRRLLSNHNQIVCNSALVADNLREEVGGYRWRKMKTGDFIYTTTGKLSSLVGADFPLWLLYSHPSSCSYPSLVAL